MKKILAALCLALGLAGGSVNADTTTSRWSLTKPDVGSTNWGPKINTNYDTIDNAAGLALVNTFTSSNTFNASTWFNADLYGPTGSASAPVYSFVGASNSGMHANSAGGVVFCVGGSDIMTIGSSTTSVTTRINGADGTAALPSFSFVSDPNTGVFDAAADILGFAAGGGTRMQVETTQVRATVPFAAADGTADAPSIMFNNDPDTGLHRTASNTFEASAGAVDVATFTANGVAIKGTTTNDVAAAGWVGQQISSSSVTNGPVGTSAQYFDIVSISLTAGDWDVTGVVRYNPNGAVSTGNFILGISATSGNSSTGLIDGDNQVASVGPVSGVNGSSMSVPNYRVLLASPATFYLKGNCTYTTATPQVAGARLSARRVR